MRKILVFLIFFMGFSTAFAEEEDIAYETGYVKLSPDIVSNLQGNTRYIRTSIQIQTNRADHLYEIEAHEAVLRHALLMTLADQNGDKLNTPDGKEKLRQALLSAVSAALDEKIETKGLITDLFFTTYYVK